jgi:hypothetical protein
MSRSETSEMNSIYRYVIRTGLKLKKDQILASLIRWLDCIVSADSALCTHSCPLFMSIINHSTSVVGTIFLVLVNIVLFFLTKKATSRNYIIIVVSFLLFAT